MRKKETGHAAWIEPQCWSSAHRPSLPLPARSSLPSEFALQFADCWAPANPIPPNPTPLPGCYAFLPLLLTVMVATTLWVASAVALASEFQDGTSTTEILFRVSQRR